MNVATKKMHPIPFPSHPLSFRPITRATPAMSVTRVHWAPNMDMCRTNGFSYAYGFRYTRRMGFLCPMLLGGSVGKFILGSAHI